MNPPAALVQLIRAPLDAIGNLVGMLEARSRMYNENAWGRNEEFAPPWKDGEIRPLFSRDASSMKGRVPFTQGMILSTREPTIATDGAAAYALRWVLDIGTGGGLVRYTIDAGGAIRLTAPAEQFRVSLMCEALSGMNFISPGGKIPASGFIADGASEGSGATYTQRVEIGAGLETTIYPPTGAAAFRVVADPSSGTTPYTADTIYSAINYNSTSPFDVYAGDFIEPLRYMPFPFNPQAIGLNIDNSANAAGVAFYLEWQIDL